MRGPFVYFALLAAYAVSSSAHGTTFQFNSSVSPVNGQTHGVITEEGITMSLQAAPTGSVFNFRTSGMGLNSRAIAGASDPETDKFNLLSGTLAGQTESITFSFDQAGVITELDFDGVKDESFEFFRLETPGGVLSIFDSQIGLRLVDISLINEPNLTLLTEAGPADDDLFDLSIPFAAGDEFKLIYGEYTPDPSNYAPGFTPEAGNGARFYGVTIEPVPEPASLLALATAMLSLAVTRHRRIV